MFVPISNTPRPYAWGAESAISELLGTTPSGEREAELWFGAHHGSPSRILEPALTNGSAALDAWIAADPTTALGADRSRLPFLVKILAAQSPLSLQAHPSAREALIGFERENADGIALDAPERNYRDAHHKPELILVLSPEFAALCGFRVRDETLSLFDELVPPGRSDAVDELRTRLVDGGEKKTRRRTVRWLLESSLERTHALIGAFELGARISGNPDRFVAERSTVRLLAARYPDDPGVVVALLLNHVTLRRGEALYLPSGNIHAYVSGVGIEIMAASDNVLRGGLTSKHVDVPELLGVLDFSSAPPRRVPPRTLGENVRSFDVDVPDFSLAHAKGRVVEVPVPVRGPAIVIVLDGTFSLTHGPDTARLVRGDAVYVTPGPRELVLTGDGECVVATTG